MGMLIYDALVLARVAAETPNRGRVLTLGVPKLNFGDADYRRASGDQSAQFSDYRGFFRHLGFETVDSLDISDYEGANILGDLNDPALPGRIPHRYDLIYDSGTLEHIFEAPTALRTFAQLTALNGAMVHSSPANGFLDHGFWQISPDLLRSFYAAAGFSILTSALFVMTRFPFAMRAENNIYRMQGRPFIVGNIPEAVIVFAGRRTSTSEKSAVQLQDYYRHMHEGHADSLAVDFFIPFGSERKARIGRSAIGAAAIRLLQFLHRSIRRS